MKRFITFVAGVIALSALPALAADKAQSDVHKSVLKVSDTLVVGDKTLKPGDYKFECRMIDGQEIMTIRDQKDVEVARVPCKAVDLGKKVDVSEFRTRNMPDKTKQLIDVRIKGETIAHTVATPTS